MKDPRDWTERCVERQERLSWVAVGMTISAAIFALLQLAAFLLL